MKKSLLYNFILICLIATGPMIAVGADLSGARDNHPQSGFVLAFDNPPAEKSAPIKARVSRLNRGEGQVYLDQGKNVGIFYRSFLCMFSPEGKELACGKVRRTSESRSMIEIDSRKARDIERGMEVIIELEGKQTG